jgi:hypothetical protein
VVCRRAGANGTGRTFLFCTWLAREQFLGFWLDQARRGAAGRKLKGMGWRPGRMPAVSARYIGVRHTKLIIN